MAIEWSYGERMRKNLLAIELAGTDDSAHLEELLELHSQTFPGHPHVLEELRANASNPREQEKVVIHQILVVVDNVPAGFVVVHSNKERKVGLIHFLAVAPEFRGREISGMKVRGLVGARKTSAK